MDEILIKLENAMSKKDFEIIMSDEKRKNRVLSHLENYKGKNAISHAINSFTWSDFLDYDYNVFSNICDKYLDLNVIEVNKDLIEQDIRNNRSSFHHRFS